jgi:hypothetical protein
MVSRVYFLKEGPEMTTIITILVIAAILCSIFAWVNTKIIIEELTIIKEHLGIKEDESNSFSEKNTDQKL